MLSWLILNKRCVHLMSLAPTTCESRREKCLKPMCPKLHWQWQPIRSGIEIIRGRQHPASKHQKQNVFGVCHCIDRCARFVVAPNIYCAWWHVCLWNKNDTSPWLKVDKHCCCERVAVSDGSLSGKCGWMPTWIRDFSTACSTNKKRLCSPYAWCNAQHIHARSRPWVQLW